MTIISLIEARQMKASPSESRSRFQRPRTTNESVVSRVAATNLSDQVVLAALGVFDAALLRWIDDIRPCLNLIHVDFRRMKTGTAAYMWLETPGAAVELDINLPGAADGEGYFGGFIFVLGDPGDYVDLPEGAFTDATLSDVALTIKSHFLSDDTRRSALGHGAR
jgi:hypothetical protein